MKASDFVQALDQFILDIFGTLIPGVAFVVGFSVLILQKPIATYSLTIFPPDNVAGWVFLIAAGYVLGHAVTSIGELYYIRLVDLVSYCLQRIPLVKNLVPKGIRTEAYLVEQIVDSGTYLAFRSRVIQIYPWLPQDDDSMKDYRICECWRMLW